MTRKFAYGLILFGICLLGDAAWDEHRGIAEAANWGRAAPAVVDRAENPKGFRSLMVYQWVRAPLILCAGLFILGLCRRADRTDPFSPDFAGNEALDDLNRTLTEEQDRRKRPPK